MLETKELVKIYKPKKGVPVTALQNVSLKFPDKGMVFLLGKSGSGKSTLLNLLGGLDNYNSGEIIIKGVSSKDFKQSHFDSYRNTYVGFIFQEYNILDEFTVGANIALAIELQNRKATDAEINQILKEVDLEGYGDRKPNELSGGQKQRVAIARALVKNPEIIMADEPSGALDSNTGRQIFDTLKKLSHDKLVIVVSHDREFAEQYADRIIELADGKVISDVELDTEVKSSENDGISFNENVVEVSAGYHLTEEDRIAINQYIDSLSSSVSIAVGTVKTSKNFKETDQSKITEHDGSKFKLIKSKLPLRNAFKIGANGLKYKKIRLVITILLSCVAFGLFGLADTFAAYNHVETCTNSLEDSDINYIAVSKSKKPEGSNYWHNFGYKFSESELKEFKNNTNTTVYGVYMPPATELSIRENIDNSVKLTENMDIYTTSFSGYGTVNKAIMDDLGLTLLAGTLPDGTKNEIAISEYIFEVFKKATYTDGVAFNDKDGKVSYNYQKIANYSDIVGKKVKIGGTEYTVTAVIDTHLDIERYASLTEKTDEKTNAEQIVQYVLFNEFSYARDYSYASVIMVGDGYVDNLVAKRKPVSEITEGFLDISSGNCYINTSYLTTLSDVKDQKIVWLGEAKTELKAGEIIVATDCVEPYEIDEKYFDGYGGIDYAAYLKDNTDYDMWQYPYNGEGTQSECKIVGYIMADLEKQTHVSAVVVDDALFAKMTDGKDKIYNYAVGATPETHEELENLVAYCYREDSNVRDQIQNSITYELDSVNEFLEEFAKIFVYIGLGFALFAALMLSNFIAMSISHKKQEIGILRAIGSRSNDVFRIFFSESFIIAMINFVLSAIGVGAVTAVINHIVRNELGILITVLSFTPRQIVLLLAVSIFVALVASFLPVKKIASKKPIDAIRNR